MLVRGPLVLIMLCILAVSVRSPITGTESKSSFKDELEYRPILLNLLTSAIQFSLFPIKHLINGKVSCMGISGYSGAGATPNEKNDPNNLEGNIIPYSLTGHIHEMEVMKHCYEKISFSPHVANFFRGILITSHIQLTKKVSSSEMIRSMPRTVAHPKRKVLRVFLTEGCVLNC